MSYDDYEAELQDHTYEYDRCERCGSYEDVSEEGCYLSRKNTLSSVLLNF